MAKSSDPILGVTALRARPTFAGALWVASALSLPVFAVLSLAELAWRWLVP